MRTLILTGMVVALLVACAPDPDNTPKIAETQRNALDKAKGVEDKVQQQAQEQKQDIERQAE